MSIACCGQTATQAPQPVQLAATIDGRDIASTAMAFSAQAKRQETQTTDCQAKQLPSFTHAIPRAGRASSTTASSIGQALAQAPHQVQAPAEKSSQGTPSKAWPSGCRLTIPSSQAATHGPSQSMQRSRPQCPAIQGGSTPAGRACRSISSRPSLVRKAPVRKPRRALSTTYLPKVLSTRGCALVCGRWHCVQT